MCVFKGWPSLIEGVERKTICKEEEFFLVVRCCLHFDTKATDKRILNQGKGFPALERAVLVIICVTKVRFYNTTLTRNCIAVVYFRAVVKYRAKRE